MNFQDLFSFAVDAVLNLDIPDEAFTDAVKAQACLLAGVNLDEINDAYPEFA